MLGTCDYVRKNGFDEVVIGLSGGVDSSLVAVIAADALGASAVHGVSLPSRYTSDNSNQDAAELAARLSASTTARSPSSPPTKPCCPCWPRISGGPQPAALRR